MDDRFLDQFARRLTQLRQARGVSARDMSLTIGQAHNYVNSIESGKSYPSLPGFLYICEYLEISPSEFFDLGTNNPKRYKDLYNEIQKLDNTSREYLFDLIRQINKRPR